MTSMRVILFSFILIILLNIAFATKPVAQDKTDRIKVVVFESFPDAFKGEDGNYQGTSIDITKVLEDGLGMKIDTEVTSWPRIMGGIGTEQFDITYLFKLKVIEDKVHFLGRTGCLADLVVPRKGLQIRSLEDLKGLRVAMLRNAAFDRATTEIDNFSKIRTTESEAMLKLLVRQRVDAIAVHSGHFHRMVHSKEARPLFPENWREILGKPFVRQLYDVHVTLSRKSRFVAIKEKISKAVEQQQKKGLFDAAMEKWGMPYWPCGE